MYYTYHPSPVGPLLLAGDEHHLQVLGFSQGNKARDADPQWQRRDDLFTAAQTQLDEYFAGKRKRFDLSLRPAGTPFQRSVLDVLLTIPYGEMWSYLDVAKAIGKPKAVRAVGAANGSNPIAIIIPCHRVVGSNGKLTGFGGGLPAKRLLLDLEGRHSGLFADV